MASLVKRCYWAAMRWPQDRPAKRARRRHARTEERAAAGRSASDPATHARAAADWIVRAQEATPDDGVAAEYLVGAGTWRSSFPETTGYIIPTLLAYAPLSTRDDLIERAERMAEWLCRIQLPRGGIQSGLVDTTPAVPTIFNTGQVMLGWLAALRHRPEAAWQQSLERAARWLCDVQDDDGCWRRHGSRFVPTGSVNTYNVRAAWALIAAGHLLDDPHFVEAGRANLDWALTQETAPGFFEHNDFVNANAPVLHTIAYTARGFLESALLLDDEAHLGVARRIAGKVAGTLRPDGSIPGRLTRTFRPACRSSCLTGIAQIAVVWHKLDRHGDTARFTAVGDRASRFLRRMQSLDHPNPGVRGGIPGSHPIGGDYAPYAYPNWAAKFFLDLMITELTGCVAPVSQRCAEDRSRTGPALVLSGTPKQPQPATG